ncbi:Verru_Chthon cassette protein A [Phragmitibacter flavus]|uniref:Verru_Chthon cassette protein A n=2 Tax=Phragmitibacter flavus TaxID=2576071 RepID=A0A5R8KJB7_9BACT|nr:Verru_Chthon cassette protein A [Phragmitibacter flavus]
MNLILLPKTMNRRRRKGVALVLVITVLLLVMFLVLGFFLNVTNEKRASRNTSHILSLSLLEDSVVGLVMAQVRSATTQGPEVGWASQPGMIRTFGAKDSLVKLYSAREMTKEVNEVPFDVLAEVPSDWMNYPGLYRDLNLPMADLEGELRYPIFDPRVEVEGLQVVGAPVSPQNEAPMPVRWLYLLKNGQVMSPLPGSAEESGDEDEGAAAAAANEVLLEGPPGVASKDNPIVGRVAFWTDDDTCKINVNTAAGDEWERGNAPGSYHDLPRTESSFDRAVLASFPPAPDEFQRYPGHPATTSMGAVFPELSREEIGGIVPRIEAGGSEGGTVWETERLAGDADRLYGSVDELVFDQNRDVQAGLTAGEIAGRGFLLSTNSRGSELNVFGWPRVAIWPLAEEETDEFRSVYDRLVAFCSSMGETGAEARFHFTRKNSNHPTADFLESLRNQELVAYLQKLTSREVPGRLGTFAGKYVADRDQILAQMVDHIRSTNIYDGLLPGGQFTSERVSESEVEPGHGQVVPLKIGDGMGLGRFYTLSEIGLQFIATATGDPADAESNIFANIPILKNQTLEKRLVPGERRIEALLLMELFSPSMGWPVLRPDMQIRITGLEQFKVNGQSLGFPADASMRHTLAAGEVAHGRSWGGAGGFQALLKGRKLPARGVMPADRGLTVDNVYPFVSVPITVVEAPGTTDKDLATMEFEGGEIEVSLYAGAESSLEGDEFLVQKIKVPFENGTFLMPRLVEGGTTGEETEEGIATATVARTWWTFSADGGARRANGTPAPQFLGRLNFAGQLASNAAPTLDEFEFYAGGMFRKPDVVRTMVPRHGDYRLIAAQAEVGADPLEPSRGQFVPHRFYHDQSKRFAHSLGTSTGQHHIFASDVDGRLVPGITQQRRVIPDVPVGVSEPALTGDWDTGLGAEMDGAYINKPDEGNGLRASEGDIPFFATGENADLAAPGLFSPNRQVSSPVMFGSLPTGVKAGKPWQTLLFRPAGTGEPVHVGAQSPPDHLLLDLFWMPVLEPYAISEPFSTAGKVNLNHQIMPFTYIERTTALRALLHSERVMAIPVEASEVYKGAGEVEANYRFAIDANETLIQWQRRFDEGQYFRTASEICEMHLVPEGRLLSEFTPEEVPDESEPTPPSDGEGGGASTFWAEHALTGDNVRERPYAGLYSRLTTKSNTYTVHYCVQVLEPLKRQRGDDPADWAKWVEKKDAVVAESRGSVTFERYLDPHDPELPDFALVAAEVPEESGSESGDEGGGGEEQEEPVEEGEQEGNLESFYRFRILSSKKFIP